MKFASALLVASVSAWVGDACETYSDCGWFECCGVKMPDTNNPFGFTSECMPDGSDETMEISGISLPTLKCAEGASFLALSGAAAVIVASLI